MVSPDQGAFANIKRKNQIIQSSNSMLNVKKVKSKVIIIKETYQNSKSEAINKKVQMKKQKAIDDKEGGTRPCAAHVKAKEKSHIEVQKMKKRLNNQIKDRVEFAQLN
jgi:hypothetical protein